MKTAIVTGGTKKDAEAMAVLALNIKKISPNIADEMVIFHDGISKKMQRKMNRIMPIRFIKYKCPISWIRLMSNRTIRYFSPMVFCKYECFHLLNEYDTVIWTDYDILIKKDISELRTIHSNCAVIVNDEVPLHDMFYKTIDNADTSGFNLEEDSICMPLFVLKKQIGDYEKYYKWCYSMTKKYISHLYLPEQCIFTMLIQHFSIEYKRIQEKTYCVHPKEDTNQAKILHAYGPLKFWNGLYNRDWEQYKNEWSGIGRGI